MRLVLSPELSSSVERRLLNPLRSSLGSGESIFHSTFFQIIGINFHLALIVFYTDELPLEIFNRI